MLSFSDVGLISALSRPPQKRPRQFNLESCLDYINEDELVEVTPNNIRLRKRYLTENERRQQYRKNNG